MNKEALYEMMDGTLGYAYVYGLEGGQRSEYMFQMTPEYIAHFVAKNAFTAEKVILTDMLDNLILESTYGGFILNCPNQNLCKQIVPHLAPLQMGDEEIKEFPIATREEMQELWDAEELAVMEAEISMLY